MIGPRAVIGVRELPKATSPFAKLPVGRPDPLGKMAPTLEGSPLVQARKSRPTKTRNDEILEMAAQVLVEKGYADTSVQDIADAVGITKGSLYYYIESKDLLLYSLIQRAYDSGMPEARKVIAQEGPAIGKLRTLIEMHAIFMANNRDRMSLYFHEMRYLSEKHRTELTAEQEEFESAIKSLIKTAKAEGDIHSWVDPTVACMGIMGMVNWIHRWYRPGGGMSARDIARQLADAFLSGIAPHGQAMSARPGGTRASARADRR